MEYFFGITQTDETDNFEAVIEKLEEVFPRIM